MAAYVRTKRAMDPLDEDAKARLRGHGYSDVGSSGSEHEPERLLSSLLHDFLFLDSDGQLDCRPANAGASNGASDVEDGTGDDDRSLDRVVEEIGELVTGARGAGDPFRQRLVSDVTEAAEALAALRSNAAGYRRAVMARLREAGYEAGLCKAKWKGSGKLVAGSYEYVDVVISAAAGSSGVEEERRYIVDLAFAAEFEVARASDEYQQVVTTLPELMVARPEAVRETVRIVAAAARRSLKARGMHVPPWRKEKYMAAKWLGAYRRTTNVVPTCSGIAIAGAVGNVGVVRAVGFATMTDVMNLPQATRIR